MKTILVLAIVCTIVTVPTARAQRGIEVTPFIGGQTNGGLNLSTAVYKRIEVQNGLNYGVTASYSIGKYSSVEFTWNHNQADTLAQSTGCSASTPINI